MRELQRSLIVVEQEPVLPRHESFQDGVECLDVGAPNQTRPGEESREGASSGSEGSQEASELLRPDLPDLIHDCQSLANRQSSRLHLPSVTNLPHR